MLQLSNKKNHPKSAKIVTKNQKLMNCSDTMEKEQAATRKMTWRPFLTTKTPKTLPPRM